MEKKYLSYREAQELANEAGGYVVRVIDKEGFILGYKVSFR